MDLSNPKQLLQAELARRCAKNPKYSLRAFAKSVGISHTVLSLVMSGKRRLSKKASLKLAEALALDPEQKSLLALSASHPRSSLEAPSRSAAQLRFHQLSLDTFSVVSDWYHLPILSLLDLPGARFEARWISKALSISQLEAKLAIERLQRLGLVEKRRNGRWKISLEGR
jgi:uncharacterized protein (TIGR02147 family)